MPFIDSAKIRVKAGDGGAGSHSMRREKYVPLGGPDGGDGGRGGSIYAEATRDLTTLHDYSWLDHFEAGSGAKGGKYNSTGRSADDKVLKVPCGTVIRDEETGALVADLSVHGQKALLARGGRGGRGNTH